MKTPRFLPHFAACALALSFVTASAAPVFSENFETDAYVNDLPIPLDFGVINHGRWNAVPKQSRPGVVIDDDGNRVLELRAVASFKRGSRAIGTFGKTNEENQVFNEALRFQFSFKMTGLITEELYMQLGGSDGRSKAVITMDALGNLLASFAGERQALSGAMKPGQWYTVEILLPAQPRTSSQYEVRLFEGRGKENEIGYAKGRMARSVTEPNYSSIDFQHQQVDQALLLDDIIVETLPE